MIYEDSSDEEIEFIAKHMNIDENLGQLSDLLHGISVRAGWYSNPETGERIDRNVGEMIALIHSEISEALEAYRKNLPDDKLPHHQGLTVELADAIIRILDLAGYLKLPIGEALLEKLIFNLHRADHKPENRAKAHGKRF